jgi:hypothetical protein
MSDQTNVGVQSLTIREASMATANTEKFLAVSAASTDSNCEHSFVLHKLVQHPQLEFVKTVLLCASLCHMHSCSCECSFALLYSYKS